MAEKQKYEVLRDHDGDRFYREGDTREAVPAEVKHLVDLGVLGEPGARKKAKAEAAPANKAETAPANKSRKA